jgi:probable rRNA maturation factor
MLRVLNALDLNEATELSLLITDDAKIAVLNEEYLGRPGPTNVLAFAMGEGQHGGVNPHVLGDVVVSVDTAKREAEQNRLDAGEHFFRLVIHGLLHLLGYDHLKNEKEAQKMYDLTEKLLEQSAA